MSIHDSIWELAKALRDADREHGRPSAFLLRELHKNYGAPMPMIAGRIGTTHMADLQGTAGTGIVYDRDGKTFKTR